MGALNLTTDTELADLLGITVTNVRDACRTKGWPCVKPKRTVWRFTDEQVAAIVAMQTVRPKASKVAGLAGQTARSARRAS